jgi:hypothetical protein
MRFQFSIRRIFAGTMAVAAGAGLWVATPSWQLGVIELILIFFVPTFAAVASLDSTGHARAFWIGVLVSMVLPIGVFFWAITQGFGFPHQFWTSDQWQAAGRILANFRRAIVLSWSFALLIGILCALAHWLIKPPKED